MNDYCYSEIAVGDKEAFSYTVTEEKMDLFFHLTGDENPLHRDTSFAEAEGYKARVVYGMLSASLLSTLAGVYLPGKYSLINSEELSFAKPVYIGDVLTVKGEVYQKNDKYNLIVLKISITNQNNEKVCRGRMNITVKR